MSDRVWPASASCRRVAAIQVAIDSIGVVTRVQPMADCGLRPVESDVAWATGAAAVSNDVCRA